MPRKRSHSYSIDTRGPRLQRVLAEAGYGSRRACEELIESGVVKVNGEYVQELPAWVDPERDRIEISGKLLRRAEKHVYVLLFKPRGVVSTNSDPEGRVRAIDLVKHPLRPRLYPVGRLDLDSSGLLLLTNDGELANRLTHPRYEVHKGYEVSVGGSLTDAEVAKLEAGIFLHDRDGEGSKTSQSLLKVVKRDRERTKLYIELCEGRNRQVRRMLLRVGHPVKKLRRIRMGPLELKGLAVGEWRELTSRELLALRKAAYGEVESSHAIPEARERAARPPRPTRPARPARPERSERAAKPERPAALDRPRKSEHPTTRGLSPKPERSERSSKPQRETRPDRASRGAKPAPRPRSTGGGKPTRRDRRS